MEMVERVVWGAPSNCELGMGSCLSGTQRSPVVSPVLAQLWTDNVGPRMKRKRVDVSRARGKALPCDDTSCRLIGHIELSEPVKPPSNMEPVRNEEEGGFVDHPMTPPCKSITDVRMPIAHVSLQSSPRLMLLWRFVLGPVFNLNPAELAFSATRAAAFWLTSSI
jgi:hypothetical protein